MTAIRYKPALNATTLKIIAVILMVFDHIYQMWAHAGAPILLSWLGRPVAPLFLSLIAESFHYTSNRKKLMLRLLLASLAMTVINFILQQYLLPNPDIMLMNNALSTVFIAALYMLFWDMLVSGIREKNAKKLSARYCFALCR